MHTIKIRNTEDAVAVIAAYATRAIAAAGHAHHTTEFVGEAMTTDAVLNRIRTAYNRCIRQGMTPKDAVIAVGQTVVASYCDRAGIPTG